MKFKNKVYLVYCGVYYEAELIAYRELTENGYANNITVYKTRAGHISVSENTKNFCKVFNNKTDALIELGISLYKKEVYVNYSNRRLPIPKEKLIKIAKKIMPEMFL